MKQSKREKLEAKGWKVGSAAEFLELTPEDEAIIELKLALGNTLKSLRQRKRMNQEAVAKLIQSSQSRVAKMETGSDSVTIDLLVKSLLKLGASMNDVAKVFSSKNKAV
ncbi:MAG: helix-turn-helix domain-containing protein [Gammaproteobacteria bacterium]|nr:helix-turn-helix domain-containing protein [Gammaproteobacteria bacterium]